jgi:hypothetical protein
LRAPILRKRLPKRSTVICAVATGYVKYHEAVRAVVLADPSRYLS